MSPEATNPLRQNKTREPTAISVTPTRGIRIPKLIPNTGSLTASIPADPKRDRTLMSPVTIRIDAAVLRRKRTNTRKERTTLCMALH